MEGKQHGDVVCAIKAGGDETKLLVVDKETDEFFKKCKVIDPSSSNVCAWCEVRGRGFFFNLCMDIQFSNNICWTHFPLPTELLLCLC